MATDEQQTPTPATELPPDEVDTTSVQIVDVRTDEERAAAHIPGDVYIPLERLQEDAGTLDRERTVVFYCRGGDRSRAAAEAFRASGWDAYSVAGGLVAWAERGLPVEPEGAQVVQRSQLPPY
ncbi:MAG TPA: rhodanese-like domain-containing protein [Thermoleophilaceae bacterium]